jgi:RNA polymerase sigma-70 factor, ECF subfamily
MEASFAQQYPRPFQSNQPRTNFMDPREQVTLLLRDAKNGNGEALDMLIPLVYDELRRLAAHYLRDERAAATLQPTGLVHEAYMRLVAQDMPEWECRAHFYGVAAHLMRQILVDHARRHRSQKRGGGVAPVPLDEAFVFAPGKSDDVLALDDALTSLAAVDERKCRIIELRYFAGLSVDETARALSVSVGTIGREQRLAEAWLHRELSQQSP